LQELLAHQSSPTRAEGRAQGKFAFALNHAREKQPREISRGDEKRAQGRRHDDHDLGPQIHDKAFA